MTIETRPDYCLGPHLRQMLSYGCTRLEISVQSTYKDVARDTNRGHTVAAIADCFSLAKDVGFKVVAHMMPDLSNVGVQRDMESFREVIENPAFRADGLKIYPTLVILGTGIYEGGETRPAVGAHPQDLHHPRCAARRRQGPRRLRVLRLSNSGIALYIFLLILPFIGQLIAPPPPSHLRNNGGPGAAAEEGLVGPRRRQRRHHRLPPPLLLFSLFCWLATQPSCNTAVLFRDG